MICPSLLSCGQSRSPQMRGPPRSDARKAVEPRRGSRDFRARNTVCGGMLVVIEEAPIRSDAAPLPPNLPLVTSSDLTLGDTFFRLTSDLREEPQSDGGFDADVGGSACALRWRDTLSPAVVPCRSRCCLVMARPVQMSETKERWHSHSGALPTRSPERAPEYGWGPKKKASLVQRTQSFGGDTQSIREPWERRWAARPHGKGGLVKGEGGAGGAG